MRREAARELKRMHRGIRRCRKCRLHEGRRHAVPGEGDCGARVMFVGEAPGEREDSEGRPFRGRSGRFLDELLEIAGVGRSGVYITSSVKCRPPRNRSPRADELATCREAWLDRQIDLVDPALIVSLGKTALKQVLGESGKLDSVHGKAREREGRTILPTYHPAAGMRFPRMGESMRRDFGAVGRRIRKGGSGR